MNINLEPVGFVRSSRTQPLDDAWDTVEAAIELDTARFKPDALAGLDAFSHVLVIYHFHRADPGKTEYSARHPRGNHAWPKVGIFAQRGKDRPNALGVTACKLLSVSGTVLKVRGLDATDGTPVLDIKPLMRGFEPREPLREPAWATEIMADYW